MRPSWTAWPRMWALPLAPGLGLCGGIAVVAGLLAAIEEWLIGYAVLEPLVLALLIGLLLRAGLDYRHRPAGATAAGANFAAKGLLEVAIVLLGASLDLRVLAGIGPRLLGAAIALVATTIVLGITFGRAAGLPPRLAILVAVGNAICGNSAIAAVAPAIRAKRQEVASAIALTAVLGVGVVLTLPLLVPLVGLSHAEYGIVAGLTVYAVPQVLAATFPVSLESGQIGTLVKLARVLLLGPVVALFALTHRDEGGGASMAPGRYLPWFVAGFILLAAARTSGLVPAGLGGNAQLASKTVTIVAMAGLGFGVELREVRTAGPRVALVVLGLLGCLVTLAVLLVTVLRLGA